MIEKALEQQYDEAAPLIEQMFNQSIHFVTKFGNFLPHGGFVNDTGQISLSAAASENDMTNSTEILPLLHEGLRQQTCKPTTRAIAVSESVFIGADRVPAIKVLVEHRDGLTIALYQIWKSRFLRSPAWGDVLTQDAEPEVGGWSHRPDT